MDTICIKENDNNNMMSKKWFVISIILFGLIINGFNFVVRSDDIKPVNVKESDFILSSYKEKAGINDNHILEVNYDKSKISLVKSDVSYKLVGSNSDISIFNDCVDVSHKVENGKIRFTGTVKKYGVYSVDLVPVIKNSLELSKYAWWNSSYSHYRLFTVDSNQVPASQTDFPALVVLNASISAKCDNGNSIRFVYLDNETLLDFEIERFNSSGESYIWVKMDNINTSSKFLMYYNNSAVSSASNPSAVWDSNYIFVGHMNQSSGSCFDSSGNNHGTFQGDLPTPNENAIGYSQYFDGIGDYITLPAGAMVSEHATIELYVKPDDNTVRNRLFVFDQDADDYTQCALYGDATPDKLNFVGKFGGVNQWDIYQSATYTTAFMHSGNASQTNDAVSILNGKVIGTDTSVSVTSWNYGFIYIGADAVGTVFKGYIDEVRVSNIRRSNFWQFMSWNTINNMTGATPFLNIGSENTFVVNATNVLPNVTDFNFGNFSTGIGICQNLSFYIYDDDGDNVFYTIEGTGHICCTSGMILNGTVWLNCTNCKWLGQTHKVFVNCTDDNNVSFSHFWFRFRTETCCSNLGDNMEITVGAGLLGIILTLVFIMIAFRLDEEEKKNIWKPIILFLDVPIALATGIFYIGSTVNSILYWIGIVMFALAIILSFAGLYYGLNFGRK